MKTEAILHNFLLLCLFKTIIDSLYTVQAPGNKADSVTLPEQCVLVEEIKK